MRLLGVYCTPHIKVPGILWISSTLVQFSPDESHPHIREFGADQYELRLEVRDMLECGAVTMPLEDLGPNGDSVAYFLQLHVRTLDGRRYCDPEDAEHAWCVVFRLNSRDELYEVASILLEAVELQRAMPSPAQVPRQRRRSTTSVPFPCLDCMAEFEAAYHQRLRSRDLKGRPTHTAADLAEFLFPPANPEFGRAPSASSSPSRCWPDGEEGEPSPTFHFEKVALRPGNVASPLLTSEMADCLVDYLPVRLRLPGTVEWVLRYTPKAHGVSISTLYRNLADHEKTVVIIQDVEDNVFGGFAPKPWEPFGRFYGSGEAFVFSFGHLSESPEAAIYPWTSKNSCFMYADNDLLAMGGGEGRHAFVVRSDLLRGLSNPTLTFGNPKLSGSEEFVVRDIEIWSLEEVDEDGHWRVVS